MQDNPERPTPIVPSPSEHPDPQVTRIGDADRAAVVGQIQQAMASGHIGFEEIDERFEKAYAAKNRSELEAVVADLPSVAAPSAPTHPAPSLDVNLLGDLERGGFADTGDGYTSVTLFGDTKLDLSSVHPQGGDTAITCWSLFGDIKVIVADGVRVQRGGVAVVGDTKERLVPPIAGMPLIKVNAYTLFGDVKVYSLSQVPEGRLRAWWKKVRDTTP